jgi:4-diphosphocytidyl-2-C-methyl-D-erythritol kinase
LIVFPNAKINLGLHVVEKRPDGFHNIETCFFPLPWKDALEIIPANHTGLSLSGLPVPGDPSDNLCLRAYHLLRKDFDLPPVRMHLHKIIPMGAGLGGGSADAAFALRLLSEMFHLMLDETLLAMYAEQLGSDCAFFLLNRPALGTGKGNELQTIDLDLRGYFLSVVYPGLEVPTKVAYGGIVPRLPERALAEVLRAGPEEWPGLLVNDFEVTVFARHPELAAIKDHFYARGAVYSAMSGSGSSLFGLFRTEIPMDWPDGYLHWAGALA